MRINIPCNLEVGSEVYSFGKNSRLKIDIKKHTLLEIIPSYKFDKSDHINIYGIKNYYLEAFDLKKDSVKVLIFSGNLILVVSNKTNNFLNGNDSADFSQHAYTCAVNNIDVGFALGSNIGGLNVYIYESYTPNRMVVINDIDKNILLKFLEEQVTRNIASQIKRSRDKMMDALKKQKELSKLLTKFST